MKLGTDTTTAPVLSNVEAQGSFTIRNSAKAFSILSSGLYSNKIKAIIRELSCNALDSHKEAGKLNVPFEVHLPNTLDSYFSVTDFGIGLDHEGVTVLYTTYFASTKQDSNDYIGALGLGSKSPFSYTDNFTVTSIKDGIQRIYSAYIDDTGCPAIAKMGECNTEKGNGVEVKFSVEQNDRNNFYREAQAVFKWFDNKPIITGYTDFQFEEIDYKERDISPGVHLKSDTYSGAVAIQGSIAYPLNLPDTENWGSEALLLECPLVINFDIGDLDIAASREELSYVPWTVANIKARIELISKDVSKYVFSQVSDIRNQWELAARLKELHKTKLFVPGVEQFINSGKCALLKMSPSGRSSYIVDNGDVLNLSVKKLKERGIDLQMFCIEHNWTGVTVKPVTPGRTPTSSENEWKIPSSRKTVFVTNDGNTGILSKLRYHFKSQSHSNSGNSSFYVVVLDVDKDKRDIRADLYRSVFRDLLRPPNTHLAASELTKRDRLESIRTNLLEAVRISDGYGKRHTGWGKVEKDRVFDPAETYYYVPVSNLRVLDRNGSPDKDFFDTTWEQLRSVKILPTTKLYGVRKSYIDVVEGEANWVCIYDILDGLVAGFDKTDIERYLAKGILDDSIINRYTAGLTDTLAVDSPFRIFTESVIDIVLHQQKDYDYISSARSLLTSFGDSTNFDDFQTKFRTKYRAMQNAYPMISFVKDSYNGASSTEKAQQMIEYISLIDNKAGV